MSDPYLKLAAVLREGARDLHDAADRLKLPYDLVCLTFNNGLLKGYWKIQVVEQATAAAVKPA